MYSRMDTYKLKVDTPLLWYIDIARKSQLIVRICIENRQST